MHPFIESVFHIACVKPPATAGGSDIYREPNRILQDLTRTEENVLGMIVGGMSNKEIAFALDVSENTVKTHVKNIFDKIGVSDRTSAATTAIKRGLVRVDL